MNTPTTPEGRARYDDKKPAQAAAAAWHEVGAHPDWHRMQQREVRRRMPVLARALDRMEAPK